MQEGYKVANYCSRHLPQDVHERASQDRIISLLREHKNNCLQCRENLRKIYLTALKEEARAGKEEKIWRYIST